MSFSRQSSRTITTTDRLVTWAIGPAGSILCVDARAGIEQEMLERRAAAVASVWLGALGQQKLAIQPHLLCSTFFFASPAVIDPEAALTCVDFPPARQGHGLAWSKTVQDVLLYMAFSWILRDLQRRTESLPFLTLGILEYVGRVMNSRKKSDAYEAVFLRDRAQALEDQIRIAATTHDIDEKIANTLAKEEEGQALRIVHASFGLTRGSAVECLRREYAEAVWTVADRSAAVTARAAMLSDYLRDSTAARATAVNLRIQRTLLALTLISAFLGLAGLSVALLPETGKTHLFLLAKAFVAWITRNVPRG